MSKNTSHVTESKITDISRWLWLIVGYVENVYTAFEQHTPSIKKLTIW